MKRFENRSVVVTGGNKGIGLAIARRFHQEGAQVTLASVEEQVQEAAAALGPEVLAVDLRRHRPDAGLVRSTMRRRTASVGSMSRFRTPASSPSPRWKT